jgi:hypothetical protein
MVAAAGGDQPLADGDELMRRLMVEAMQVCGHDATHRNGGFQKNVDLQGTRPTET